MTSISPFRLKPAEAAAQWRHILVREWPSRGGRQENFRGVEVVVSLVLLTVVDPATQGGSDWGRYHPELRRLSTLCKRPPGSFAEKERNLLGTRPNAGRGEHDLFLATVNDPLVIFELWAPVLEGARLAGIAPDQLPDFLDIETNGQFVGQEALTGDWDRYLGDDVETYRGAGLDPATSERAAMAMARIGQHRFARTVRLAYHDRCGFCGFNAQGLEGFPAAGRISHQAVARLQRPGTLGREERHRRLPHPRCRIRRRLAHSHRRWPRPHGTLAADCDPERP